MNEQKNIRGKFAKYVSLNVCGMVGISLYILADTFFIAQAVGADGITALKSSFFMDQTECALSRAWLSGRSERICRRDLVRCDDCSVQFSDSWSGGKHGRGSLRCRSESVTRGSGYV